MNDAHSRTASLTFEPLPTLTASAILQPQYLQGANFTARNPVPTYSGENQYTLDSDFGVFTAAKRFRQAFAENWPPVTPRRSCQGERSIL